MNVSIANPMIGKSQSDALADREAKVIFAGIAPIIKGAALHLEYPRVGTRLGVIQAEEGRWFHPDRMRLPGMGIIYVGRDCENPVGPFHWVGRFQGIIEVVVRACEIDAEVQQTYLLVDVIAERKMEYIAGQALERSDPLIGSRP